MRTKKQKKKELSDEQLEIVEAKDFFDRTMPGVIRFYTDHYICGNFYKSCWAVTENILSKWENVPAWPPGLKFG